jgi:hypothetical protein
MAIAGRSVARSYAERVGSCHGVTGFALCSHAVTIIPCAFSSSYQRLVGMGQAAQPKIHGRIAPATRYRLIS